MADKQVSEDEETVAFVETDHPDVEHVPERKRVTTHTVETGDTITSIEAKYGVSYRRIAVANKLDRNYLTIGQKLTIPKN